VDTIGHLTAVEHNWLNWNLV